MPKVDRRVRKAGVEGTVSERSAGRFFAYLPPRVYPDGRWAIPDSAGNRPGVFHTATQARRALDRYIADIDAGRRVAPTGSRLAVDRRGRLLPARERTIMESVDGYIKQRTANAWNPLAARTIVSYTALLEKHICHPRANIGGTALTSLLDKGIEKWRWDLLSANVRVPTIMAAQRLLSAALEWEISEGRLTSNAVKKVHRATGKARTGNEQVVDVVLLSTWKELSVLVSTPESEEDRLMVAVMAWTGLRWSEIISLRTNDIWRDRPTITVERVLVRTNGEWKVERPKAGKAATVDLPFPLWERLVLLANQRQGERALPMPAGKLLFRISAETRRDGSKGIIDNKNWNRSVWSKCRVAANLNGDEERPLLDPRRRPVKIKDLRAFTASMLHDAGATHVEVSLFLRHADWIVTKTHYLRAVVEAPHSDTNRPTSTLRGEALSMQGRIDKMWEMWLTAFPTMATKLGLPGGNSSENSSARLNLRFVK